MCMKKMDHNDYPKSLKSKPWAALQYIMKDARAAIRANPDNENVGYYQDEINYCCNEMNNRKTIGQYGPR